MISYKYKYEDKMTKLRNAIITGLAALLAGCATGQSARTQDSPVTSSVSTTQYDSVSKRFDRLRELERPMGGASASMNGYVMGVITEVSLKVVAGVYSGTVKVITDGEGNFLSEGTYFPLAHLEAMERAIKEADTNDDKIITSDETELLSQRVFHQYAQRIGKEEFKRKVCTSKRDNELDRCGFKQSRASSKCEFDYSRKGGNVDFDKHREESDCEFNSFRTQSNPKPCLDGVAGKYTERAQQAKAVYTACLDSTKKDAANCGSRVEEAYRACLGAE